jgi:CheY-like chemotaxis protein
MRTNKKVLAVDDNPINLGILEEMLSGEYRLEFAQNGPDAIRAATRFRPAVILLDVMMPGMDGLETCRELRQTAGLRDTVIIMVSAKAMPSEQAAGINAGADAYITKPFDEVELLTLLRRVTNTRVQVARGVDWDEPNDAKVASAF